MIDVSIIIPVYNEEAILSNSLARVSHCLNQRQFAYEVLVVDNGSTDRTWEIATELAKEHDFIRPFQIEARGPGRAFAFGVKQAKSDIIVTLDADLSADLVFLDYAMELLKHGSMVVGSKSFGKERRTWLRILGSHAYILATQALFDLSITDYSMGCKGFRRQSILPVLDFLDPWTGYIFELALYLSRRGAKIIQVGVDCEDTRPSRFSLIHEGFYRFRHLAKCRKLLSDKNSWIQQQ